jgi:hypothetical protein
VRRLGWTHGSLDPGIPRTSSTSHCVDTHCGNKGGKLTSQTADLRRGLTALDRALLRHLIDSEVRRRHEDEFERINATRRRFLAEKQETRPAGT